MTAGDGTNDVVASGGVDAVTVSGGGVVSVTSVVDVAASGD